MATYWLLLQGGEAVANNEGEVHLDLQQQRLLLVEGVSLIEVTEDRRWLPKERRPSLQSAPIIVRAPTPGLVRASVATCLAQGQSVGTPSLVSMQAPIKPVDPIWSGKAVAFTPRDQMLTHVPLYNIHSDSTWILRAPGLNML